MQTGSAPAQTSLPNFHPDQTPVRSLPPASTADGIDPSAIQLLKAPPATPQSGIERPILPANNATSELLQPTINDQTFREVGGVSLTKVACVPCRLRKTRCDGRRPSCSGCRKRDYAASCSYEVLRRRGPDKHPGRIRGPSRSTASLEKKKQVRKQKASPLGSASIAQQLPTTAPVVSQIQESDAEIRPVATAAYSTTRALSPPISEISSNSTLRVHMDTRPPMNNLLLPSPDTGLIPPSSSSSSQFSSSSTQNNSGYSAYPTYQHGVGRQSTYAPTPSTTEPTTTSWAPPPSSSYMQLFTAGWSADGEEQRWHASDQLEGTITYWHDNPTSDLQVWEPHHIVNDHGGSHFRHGRTQQSVYTNVNTIVREPSLHFSCETWWDTVLYIYGTDQTSLSLPSDSAQPSPWHGSRHDAAVEISNDVYNFFKIASNWLSFINVPLFLGQFHHPDYRKTMQPALVLAVLAYLKLLQTSQEAMGSGVESDIVMLDATEKMWRKSFMLRELAQAAFDASYNAGWIDTPLAQAAWILGLYEYSAHRDSSPHRIESSLIILDNVVHVLGLKTLDKSNPRTATFKAKMVPALGRLNPDGQLHQHLGPSADLASQGHVQLFLRSIEPLRPAIQYQATTQQTPFDLYRSVNNPTRATRLSGSRVETTKGCPCHALSLAGSSEAQKSTPLWLSTPQWNPEAGLAEIQKEEARRLVWSTIALISGDATARVARGIPQLNLHTANPENYAVLFPGEELYASRPQVDVSFSGKESTWALHGRTMLLWYTCVTQIAAIKKAAPISFLNGNVNGGLLFTSEQLALAGHNHADFAMRAWMESLAIEEALNEHTCDGEKATMYQARENLFTIRMFITGGFRRYVPHPQSGVDFSRLDREKAMQWLHHQNNVANQLQMIMGTEHSPARYLLVKRPYLMWWQMNLIGRALQLWVLDRSLTFAVDVALKIYPILKWFERVWPCPEQQRWSVSLEIHLAHICGLLGKQIPN
ncbi:hypothetical protein FRB95_010559 [Tulasnella sp. JGI-2019a]|nr:hypothetical protein FRB95_010559 [Tulasnella sp. JGI-2019a]